jgi:hypothetical protein
MHFFARNSCTDNAVPGDALSWWSSKDPIVCNFNQLASPSFSDTPGHQDNISDSLRHQVVQILNELPSENIKNYDHCLDFWFAHARFLLFSRVWHVSFLTLPLGFRVIFEKSSFITCYDPIKKIWFGIEPLKHFYQHFVSTHFLIVIQIFWNHLCTHTVLMSKSCVTIWWNVHSLISSSSVIIRIVNCPSWRMKGPTWLTFVLVLT